VLAADFAVRNVVDQIQALDLERQMVLHFGHREGATHVFELRQVLQHYASDPGRRLRPDSVAISRNGDGRRADITHHLRGGAGNDGIDRHILRNHGTGTPPRVFANYDPWADRRIAANIPAALDDRASLRIQTGREGDVGADRDIILQLHTVADL